MSTATPIIFLSAASVDLKDWRDHLHHAFSRAGFRVLTQEQSLRSAPGDVRRLLTETIDEADCVIHLAGMGYGSHATEPFPDAPDFQCSWTQFEYYHAHQQKKDVIAFVCAPDLSKAGYETREEGDATERLLKQSLQETHRQRVATGDFTGTPLEGIAPRTSNESIAGSGKLMESVAAAIGTLRTVQREQIEQAQSELRSIGDRLSRLEHGQRHTLRWVMAATLLLALVALGVWWVKRDTQEAKHDNKKVLAAQDNSARREADLAAQMSQVQQALAKIQQNTDPKEDPISRWPRERLEAELARQMNLSVTDLRALLTAGSISLDALIAGQALLASGKAKEAGEKFDAVLQQEQAAMDRARQAWQGKGQIAHIAARYEDALQCYQKAAALVDEAEDPLAWVRAQSWVAAIQRELARNREAESLLREIVETCEKHSDLNRTEYAEALGSLAIVLKRTNRFAEAESLYRRALEVEEARHGKEHPEVAEELINLAEFLRSTNRLDEAMQLYLRTMALLEKTRGEGKLTPRMVSNHLTVANSLGQWLQELGQFDEAEQMMRMYLQINEAGYGKNHPSVAVGLGNLAVLLLNINRHAEAEPMLRRALEIYEASYGKDHPQVATGLNNLANLLEHTNRLAEAEPLMRRALEIGEAAYGKNNPEIAPCLNSLAGLLQATNRPAEAEPLYRRAVLILENPGGKPHLNYSSALSNLAGLLQQQNRLSEAEAMFRRALELDEASYGKNHPKVGIKLNNLADLLHATNRLAEAEPLMRRVLEIYEASYGKDHPDVALALNNLANLLHATNRSAEAEPMMRRALEIDQASYGKDHPAVAIVLGSLALLLHETNRLADAEPLMRRALEIDEASYVKDHPNIAIRLNNLALLLRDTNRLAEAEPLSRRAVEITVKLNLSTGHEHPKYRLRLANYRGILESLNLPEAEIAEKLRSLEPPAPATPPTPAPSK